MPIYKTMAREFLSEYTDTLRKNKHLTQEKMAEYLHITSRAYGDLEKGKYCFSAITLLFLFLMLDDDEVKAFLNEFRKRVKELEQQEVA